LKSIGDFQGFIQPLKLAIYPECIGLREFFFHPELQVTAERDQRSGINDAEFGIGMQSFP
jgi:hypothetical protein